MSEVNIEFLGRQGDGIATINGRQVFVPYTLPGETVRVGGSGQRLKALEILEQSPDRTAPVCRHFGTCGGCQVQHLSSSAYTQWKLSLVSAPLAKSGINCPVDPLVEFEPALRRKSVFNVRNAGDGVVLGFAARASDQIIPIETCPVTDPAITNKLDDLKNLVQSLPQSRTSFRLSVLATENGLDVHLEGKQALRNNQKEVLIRKAIATDLARLACDSEILVETRSPRLKVGSCSVVSPPGGFVQAVEPAELHMAHIVKEHLSGCKSVADLFSGMGTFALRLAEHATVWAIEENSTALEALDPAWRETGGKLKQIKVETRNLDRRPASFQELKKIDGLVFDRPRAGAEMQARQIAKSKVGKLAAVSCNPVTLARDLEILVSGGYRISRIVALDQFRFTPHVEVVALLER